MIVEWILYFTTSAIEAFTYIYFFDIFLECKWNGAKKYLACVLLYVVQVVNTLICESLPQKYIPWKMLTLILISMIFIKISYRSTWVMSGFFASLISIFQIQFGVVTTGLLSYGYSDGTIHMRIMAIVMYLVMVAGLMLLRRGLSHIRGYLKKDQEMLMKYTWIPIISVVPGVYFYFIYVFGEEFGYFNMFMATVMIVINIALLFYLQDALIKDEQLKLAEIQNRKNQNQLQAFHDMQSLYDRQGRKLHDYKKQIGTMQEMLKAGDVDAAIVFSEQLTQSIAVEVSEINVGHPVINAVLNQQYRIAKSKGIGMTFAISDLHDIKLSDDDIVVMLGNLLENAIHECEKVTAQGRTTSITVKFVEREGKIILNVRNPVGNKVEIVDNKVTQPSQEGHGIGLSNVESVAEKNGGSFAIFCDENEFVAAVVI